MIRILIISIVFLTSKAFAQNSWQIEKIAVSLAREGKVDSAKLHIYQSLELSSSDTLSANLFLALVSVGIITNDFDLRDKSFESATDYLGKYPTFKSSFYLNRIFLNNSELENAIIGFTELLEDLTGKRRIKCLLNIATAHLYNDSFKLADTFLQRAVRIKEFSLRDSITLFQITGALEYNMGNFEGAASSFESLKSIYFRKGDLIGIRDQIYNLHLISIEKGDLRKGADFIFEYDSFVQVINSKYSRRLEEELEVKFDVKQKEQEAQVMEERAKNNRTVIWILAGALLVIIPLLFWFSYSVKTIRVKNRELEDAHASLETVNERLEKRVEERTIELEERNKRLERYAFATSHKLRKPLANILGLISLFSNEIDNDTMIDMLERSSEELDLAVRHMGEILDRKDQIEN
ncbi:MAG: hypothetical protein JXQ87_14475 [Bacteroidia bacterium]